MSHIMENDDGMGLLIGGFIKQIEEKGGARREEKEFTGNINKLQFDEKMIFVDFPGCVYCFRKSFFEQIADYGFDRYPHDALLLRMGKLLGVAYYYDAPVIYWRRHNNNATGKPVRTSNEMIGNLEYYLKCLQQMKKYCEHHSGYSVQEQLINNNIQFYKTRLAAFKTKKIIGKESLFSCIKFLNYYPKPRSILGDIIRITH